MLHRWLTLLAFVLSTRSLGAQGGTAPGHLPRKVEDPGFVTTNQRVTPAGDQTVFNGRVDGVSFGTSPDEVWALVAGSVGGSPALYRLSWRDNRVLNRVGFTGSPGPQALVMDPQRGTPLVGWVDRVSVAMGSAGRTDGPPAPMISAVRLGTVELRARSAANGAGAGDTLLVLADRLGSNTVAAIAVAARENAAGQRIAVVPLTFNDSVAVVDTKSGALLRRAPTGIAPFGAAVDSFGTVAWVTNWGGRRPEAGDQTAPTGVDLGADRVVVDERGIASTGTVTRVDLTTGRATHTVAVGLHPTAIVWDLGRQRVYVADGNSDAVSVIASDRNKVVQTIAIAPFRDRTPGLAPTALALSRDGATLYVALGGLNAVGVFDALTGHLAGLIPTGWYPSALAVSADGRKLAVGALFGVGSGSASAELARRYPADFVAGKRYVHSYRGTVNVLPVPSEADLASYTAAVAANSRLTLASAAGAPSLRSPRAGEPPQAVPERHGEPSLIDHVVYVVKENRTYDQLFGDIAKGDGDSSLVLYGDSVTPNHHRLAEQFVLLDRFFATGGNSGDGHQWVTQANETEYTIWPGYGGRSYPFDGADPIAPASGGFIWDAVLAKGKSVKVFGEYAGIASPEAHGKRLPNLEDYRRGADFTGRYHTVAPIKRLNTILAANYPAYGGTVPDVVRAQIFLSHLAQWTETGAMPNLVIVQLPSDHTNGTQPEYTTPAAALADNDLALGKIVEGLSHSPFWKSMAVFIVEDDAQGGVDHVDGHRTVALAVSPYIRRGAVDHTMYSHPSMLKTIELMLGLRPLSVFDLVATDMRASFIAPGTAPDLTPYAAVEPKQSIYQENPKAASLTGPARAAALASARMRFDVPDAAPSEALNRILWHAAKGWSAAYPGARHSLFFPMALETDDEDRPAANSTAKR